MSEELYEWKCPKTNLECEFGDGQMRIQFSLDNEEMRVAHDGYAAYLTAHLAAELAYDAVCRANEGKRKALEDAERALAKLEGGES